MSRLQGLFERLGESGRSALTTYIAAGDPQPDVTVDALHTLVKSGAEILEIGVPFSDPMADGPVIQKACERALVHDVSLNDVIEMVAEFRRTDSETPIVLMGYMNPIEAMGAEDFAAAAGAAGVDGVITVDLPPDASEALIPALQNAAIDPVFLVSPTTTEERVKQIAAVASGFIYYVSLKGVTGANTLDVDDVDARLQDVRRHTDLPLGVGFGISDANAAAAVSAVADAVVVGSAVVNRMANNAADKAALLTEIGDFVSGLRRAMDAAAQTSV
ncbi:MAG: tryptophan synthase subunit alpha [Pseudomonadota bacterium]